MQKILLAVNAASPDKNALEFACYLARLTGSAVTGIFLENTVADEHPVLKRGYGMSYVDWEVDENSSEQLLKRSSTEQTVTWFKEGCIARDVCFKIHHDRNVPVNEVLQESRFADVLVMDAETNFKNIYVGSPGEFAKDVMRKAECPVVIAPADFNAITEVIFLYNATASSVFAIKQFTYLFPQLRHTNISVLQVNESGTWEEIDKYHFKEWLNTHYSSVKFIAEKGSVCSAIFKHTLVKPNAFVVMGAYGRSVLSLLIKHSTADQLIRIMNLPFFITHT